MNGGPLLPACRLWEKTSARGTRYLVGRWGGVKVLILPNRDWQGDDDATHILTFTEAPARTPAAIAEASAHAQPPAAPSIHASRPAQRRASTNSTKVQIDDDPVPF